jgi:hypothetical protein
MDSNKRKSNWRRIQERYRGVSNAYERKAILSDALLAIEKEHGTSAAELIYPYEKLIELHHELGEYENAAPLLPLYYLALEMNNVEEPERLLAAIERMRERGYLSEAINACCRLVYLLYESRGVKRELIDDAWYLLDELHTQHPDVNAKKLLKYLGKKQA